MAGGFYRGQALCVRLTIFFSSSSFPVNKTRTDCRFACRRNGTWQPTQPAAGRTVRRGSAAVVPHDISPKRRARHKLITRDSRQSNRDGTNGVFRVETVISGDFLGCRFVSRTFPAAIRPVIRVSRPPMRRHRSKTVFTPPSNTER